MAGAPHNLQEAGDSVNNQTMVVVENDHEVGQHMNTILSSMQFLGHALHSLQQRNQAIREVLVLNHGAMVHGIQEMQGHIQHSLQQVKALMPASANSVGSTINGSTINGSTLND